MEIKIRNDLKEKIEKYVKEGRYRNIDEFMNAAADTLLMAEDRNGMFEKLILP